MRTAILALGACLVALAGTAPAAGPAFTASVTPIPRDVTRAMTGVSWRPGCPVPLRDLRLVTLRHWDFEGRVRTGRVVVHRDAAAAIVRVFSRLFDARFPVRRIELVDRYGASDWRSIEADNTSAFNCRYVDGTTRWSDHAYGRAIDVNPIENPYVGRSGQTSHAASRPYVGRTPVRPGMAVEGGPLVEAFDAVGWGWGGRWTSVRDYQHFSASGR